MIKAIVYNSSTGHTSRYAKMLSEENTNNLIKTNNIDKPLFYLQGGLDYNKLNWLKTKILHMVGKHLEKENNNQSTQLAKIFENGADFVTEENLKEIIEFLEK